MKSDTSYGWSGIEKRASARARIPVRCWILDGAVDRYGFLADISKDGARVFTVAPPSVGGMVRLRCMLRPGGNTVEARARIVWRSEGFGGRGGVIGVQFLDVVGAEEIAACIEEG